MGFGMAFGSARRTLKVQKVGVSSWSVTWFTAFIFTCMCVSVWAMYAKNTVVMSGECEC